MQGKGSREEGGRNECGLSEHEAAYAVSECMKGGLEVTDGMGRIFPSSGVLRGTERSCKEIFTSEVSREGNNAG